MAMERRSGQPLPEAPVVRVRVVGVFLARPMNHTFEEPHGKGDTPKKVLARLDKKKALGKKFFKGALKDGSATFLLNGDRLESFDQPLEEGDELSVLSAIAGG